MTPRKFLKLFIFVVIVANLVIVAVVFLGGSPAPTVPLPNPNGYDDIVKAAGMLTAMSVNAPANQSEWAPYVHTNTEALKLVRTGLSRECRVPIEYSTNFVNSHFTTLAEIKAMGHALQIEGRLAESENRTNDAFNAYLDAVHFGHECGRGGLTFDELVGIACQNIGLGCLRGIRASLDAAQCRQALNQLLALEAKRETTGEIIAREAAWSRKVGGLQGRFAGMIVNRSLDPYKHNRLSLQKKIDSIQAETRHLMLDLAARAYTLEKGSPPKSAAELVPAYLPAIPFDPVTGTNMVYLP